MQKSASTILIAFLAGIVVAGGTAFMVSSLRHEDVKQPAQEIARVQTPAVPASTAPATETATPQPVEPRPQPKVQQPVAPKPASSEPAVSPRHKRRPGVEYQKPVQEATNTEEAAAPQPTAAETVQSDTPQGTNAPSDRQNRIQQENGHQQDQPLNPPPGTQTAPPAPTPQTVTLPAGTQLSIRVNETISTDTNYPGDAFTATLEKPIVVNGFIIADRGARVTGKVVQAEKAGRMKGVANLQLALTQLHTTDGQTVKIVTTPWDKRGATSKKRDAAEMAGGAALGAIIGAIAGGGTGAAIGAGTGGAAGTGVVLSQRGKAATIPSETRLIFTLDNPVTITERL